MKELQDSNSSLAEIFGKTSPGLLEVLESMLHFNPHFRPTASQLLRHEIFDGIRQAEQVAPKKLNIDIDEGELGNEYHADYFSECMFGNDPDINSFRNDPDILLKI